ncbi:membrane hypothetical protein [Candidatus Zixiibacteriota bacterium]|nr:membrane hypothetical protein [candidate division Zixibacteria bacterium]
MGREMGFIEKLNRLIGLYLSVFKLFGRLSVWIPFFVYALLQFGLLLFCVSYIRPAIYPMLSPIVALLGQNADVLFSHYPGLYLMLPQVFQWGKLLLGFIFEGLAAGMTAVLFLHFFSRGKYGEIKSSDAFKRWGQLLAVWAIITILLVLLNRYFPMAAAGFVNGSPRRVALMEILMRLITIGVYAMFVYAVPAVVVERTSIWRGIRLSLNYFARYPIFSFFLALLPYLLTIPVTYITSNSDVVVSKFSPELIFYVLVAGIIIDMIMNFLLTGAVVKFLVEEGEG